MIALTLNCRGLSNTPKTLELKRVVEAHNLNVLLLQEIMSERRVGGWGGGAGFMFDLEKICEACDFNFIDSRDRSKGLISRWKRRSSICSNYLSFVSGLEIMLYS
jgi:hypothetical protein